jgi:hypothetical protein
MRRRLVHDSPPDDRRDQELVTDVDLLGRLPIAARTVLGPLIDIDSLEDPRDPICSRMTLRIFAVLPLIGAALLIFTVLMNPCTESARPSAVPAALIHGAQALRPDLLSRPTWPFLSSEGSGSRSPAHPPRGADPTVDSRGGSIKVVNDFYQRLGTDPGSAVELICPRLLGGETSAVVRSWKGMASVRPLHVDPQPDGSVVAEALAEYGDGTDLILRHRFVVQSGPQPKIISVELLAARHFRA